MSGPKGSEVRVVSQAELRRREDEARRGRCEEMSRRLSKLLSRLETPESNTLSQPKNNSHGGLISWESALLKMIAQTETRLEQERIAREIAAIRTRCAPVVSTLKTTLSSMNLSASQIPAEPSGDDEQAWRKWERALSRKTAELEQLKKDVAKVKKRSASVIKEIEKMLAEMESTRTIPAAPEVYDLSQFNSWEQSLKQMAAEIRPRYYEAHAKKVVAKQREGRGALKLDDLTFDTVPAVPVAPSAQKAEAKARERLANEVNRVTALLDSLEDDNLREELFAFALRVSSCEDLSQARGDLVTLKDRANAAITAQAIRKDEMLAVQAVRKDAQEAVLKVAQYQTEEAGRLQARADAVANEEDLRQLNADIEAYCKAEEKKADAAFIQKALEEALVELGFDLGEGFELTDYGTVAYARHDDYADHVLRMQYNPENGKMFSRIVALGDTDPEADAAVEEASCEKVHAISRIMGEKGVEVNLTREVMPGEQPVEHIERESYGVFSAPQQQNRVYRQQNVRYN